MIDPLEILQSLRRPRLLVRAARHGVVDYNRDRFLRRLMPGEALPGPGQAFGKLAEREQQMDETRREGAAAYSAARHIELLVALMEEARLAVQRRPA